MKKFSNFFNAKKIEEIPDYCKRVAYVLFLLEEPEGPYVEVGQLFLLLDANADASVRFRDLLGSRPILDAHDLDEIEGLRQHDDAAGFFLPHHPPEVRHRLLRRPLRHYVCVWLEQTLERHPNWTQ